MAATQTLSQLPEYLQPRNGVITLFGYGIQVRVDRGHLLLQDAIGTNRRYGRLPRVDHGLKRLVVIGTEGMISLGAMRWLADQEAAFVLLNRDGTVLATTSPVRSSDSKLRRAQAFAARSEVGLYIARELISRKLAGQERVARDLLRNLDAAKEIALCRTLLPQAIDIDEVRSIEALAAAEYWSSWHDLPILFPTKDHLRIPDHWCKFGTRKSPLSGSPRLAANPPNAMLNYLYALLESEAALGARCLGLDSGLGILHVDTPARDSLACDLMEAVRSEVDRYVLRWVLQQPLRRDWFFERRDGNCRLMAPFAARLAETTPLWAKAVAPVVEWVAQQLWSTTRRRSHADLPPTHLTQTHRREAKRLSPASARHTDTRFENLCRGCGKRIGEGGTNCAQCTIPHATNRLIQAAQLGRVAGHTPEALLKEGQTQRKHSLARSAWRPSMQPAWLTDNVYSEKVHPMLSKVSSSAIAARIGVSRWYAGRIRKGYRPHPRHWLALARMVGLSKPKDRKGR